MAKKTCKFRNDLSPKYIRQILIYNPLTGIVKRKTGKRWYRAGFPTTVGYLYIMIDRKLYLLHRLIFVYMTGRWPINSLDHRNGNRTDNRWCNLREATDLQNACNKKMQQNNTSGFKGVCYRKNRKHWYAQIKSGKKHQYLGAHPTKKAASAAYWKAAQRLHGEFARL